MANTTKNMQQIRHILQLRAQGVGIREIVHRSGISRPTVRAYLRRWEAMGLSWEQLGALDDEALGAIVYQESAPSADLVRQVRAGALSEEDRAAIIASQLAAQIGSELVDILPIEERDDTTGNL